MKRDVIELKKLIEAVDVVMKDIAEKRGVDYRLVNDIITDYAIIMERLVTWKIVINQN